MKDIYNLYICFGTIPKLFSIMLHNEQESYDIFCNGLKYFGKLGNNDIDFVKEDYLDIVKKQI